MFVNVPVLVKPLSSGYILHSEYFWFKLGQDLKTYGLVVPGAYTGLD